MNSSILKAAIRDLHHSPNWHVFTEYRIGGRVADAIAVNEEARYLVGYEVKVSLEDFRLDLAKPAKRAPLEVASNEFYFVTPRGLNLAKKIPAGCGLIEYPEGGDLQIVVPSAKKTSTNCQREHLDATLKRLLRFRPDKVREALNMQSAVFVRGQCSSGQKRQLRALVQDLARRICETYGGYMLDLMPGAEEEVMLPRGYLFREDNGDGPWPFLGVSEEETSLALAADGSGREFSFDVSFCEVLKFIEALKTGWLDELESFIGYRSSEADDDLKMLAGLLASFPPKTDVKSTK